MCIKFVNQQFLILIIAKKMGAVKEQNDSCFTQLNEQAAERSKHFIFVEALNKNAQS